MALSHRALELATRFRDAIEKEFARWEDAAEPPPKDRSLSLMSEAELEIHLAGQQFRQRRAVRQRAQRAALFAATVSVDYGNCGQRLMLTDCTA